MFGSIEPVQPGFQRSEKKRPQGRRKKKKPPKKANSGHQSTESRFSAPDQSDNTERLDIRI